MAQRGGHRGRGGAAKAQGGDDVGALQRQLEQMRLNQQRLEAQLHAATRQEAAAVHHQVCADHDNELMNENESTLKVRWESNTDSPLFVSPVQKKNIFVMTSSIDDEVYTVFFL